MNEHLFNIGNEWDALLKPEFEAEYCQSIKRTLDTEYKTGKVYPPRDRVFAALQMVDYASVRVCILGQDPYHGAGQANGMAFAVCEGIPHPPSLANIFAELKSDCGIAFSPLDLKRAGTLLGWAAQGVLLLNASLTVREASPQSHAALGWGRLTDAIINMLSQRKQPIVFILWGASAIAKSKLIAPHHCIISSPHPSPLSAHRGFFGSKPFTKANEFLTKNGFSAIDWGSAGEKACLKQKAAYYEGGGSITRI